MFQLMISTAFFGFILLEKEGPEGSERKPQNRDSIWVAQNKEMQLFRMPSDIVDCYCFTKIHLVHFLNFFIFSGPRGFREKKLHDLDSAVTQAFVLSSRRILRQVCVCHPIICYRCVY